MRPLSRALPPVHPPLRADHPGRWWRAGGEDLDYILMSEFGAPEGGEGGQQGGATGFVNQLGVTISGLQRFMRSLSQ